MTPSVKLPLHISCWGPPTYPHQLTRFGKVKQHPSMMPIEATSSAQAQQQEIMQLHNLYGEVSEYEKELAQERLSLQPLESLSIPVQPRKHLPQQQKMKPQISINENQRYHLRSSSGNPSQSLNMRPRVFDGIEGELDALGELEQDEEAKPQPKFPKTIQNYE